MRFYQSIQEQALVQIISGPNQLSFSLPDSEIPLGPSNIHQASHALPYILLCALKLLQPPQTSSAQIHIVRKQLLEGSCMRQFGKKIFPNRKSMGISRTVDLLGLKGMSYSLSAKPTDRVHETSHLEN